MLPHGLVARLGFAPVLIASSLLMEGKGLSLSFVTVTGSQLICGLDLFLKDL